jgi:hypothetical protein
MFFASFNKVRNKQYIALLVYTLITCFIITSTGCETTTSDRYTSENLKTKKKLEGISHIILKDGTYINTEDKDVFYYEKYRDSNNVFVFSSLGTTKVFENGKYITKLIKNETFLPLSNVQEVYVTRTEVDAGKTILLTVGIAVAIVLVSILVLIISFASSGHNSCPYIYSFDGNKYIYDAEPLGGVICEGLVRTDYSRLEHLAASDGKFKLFVRNENDEQQHLDEMKLLSVNHEEQTFVTPDIEGKFFEYKTIVPPVSVTDENGNDVTGFFTAKDDYGWQTDMQKAAYSREYSKHSLKFRFKKPEGAKNALLFFNGGISQWGSEMVKTSLELRGNKIDNWYFELNKRDTELKKLHNYILEEELYYLKVNLLENGKYNVKTVIPGGGPKVDEDKVFNLPLENVQDNYVEFVLNPPPGYWKFEQIGLIYDYKTVGSDDIKVLDASYGQDRNGFDLLSGLNKIDKIYYDMPDVGNSFDLNFNVPENYNKETCELFLKTNGWYEINIDKSKPEQTELINDIFNNPGNIINYSMKLYKQKIKNLTELKLNNHQNN